MATILLKKSYQLKDLKEVNFLDLWNSHGIFTTMRILDKPYKILFFEEHINNLIRSLKIFKIKNKSLRKKIINLIKLNLDNKKKYNHLLRIAVNKKFISIVLRKRVKTDLNLNLNLINYKRFKPEFKNLKYKKILSFLKKIDTKGTDLVLCVKNQILETATSNILFVSQGQIYSPVSKFYKGITLKFFEKTLKKIIKKKIYLTDLYKYDEIILVGSGKGVATVKFVNGYNWKRKSLKTFKTLSKIYNKAVTNCDPYNC